MENIIIYRHIYTTFCCYSKYIYTNITTRMYQLAKASDTHTVVHWFQPRPDH